MIHNNANEYPSISVTLCNQLQTGSQMMLKMFWYIPQQGEATQPTVRLKSRYFAAFKTSLRLTRR